MLRPWPPLATTSSPTALSSQQRSNSPSPRLLRPVLRLPRPAPCRRAASPSSPPGVSHDAGAEMSTSDSVGQNDLLIVGPGVLGRIVAEKWQKENPSCKIFGQTATTDNHRELAQIGIVSSLKGSRVDQKVPYVIFCAPPYRSDDYPEHLRVAASNWNGEGSFLFTSSTAVYDCSDNGLCSEDSPCMPIGRSPQADVLLKAENVVLEAGGCVLRLVGLYISSLRSFVFFISKLRHHLFLDTKLSKLFYIRMNRTASIFP